MANLARVEEDLHEYLTKEPNLRREDRVKYLKAIFQKHMETDSLQHVISARDLFTLVSIAADRAASCPAYVEISGEKVSGHNPIHIGMIESFIGYLNKHSLLRRGVGFEYGKKGQTNG